MELANIIISLLAVIVACLALYQTAIISKIRKTIESENIIFKKKVETYENAMVSVVVYMQISYIKRNHFEDVQSLISQGGSLTDQEIEDIEKNHEELKESFSALGKALTSIYLLAPEPVIESLNYIEFDTDLFAGIEECRLVKVDEQLQTIENRLDLLINQLRQDLGINTLHNKFSDRIGHLK